jgi:hypothetical protein
VLEAKDAKKKVIQLLASGAKIAEAMRAVQRRPDTYRDWYRLDPEFRAEVQYLRALAERAAADKHGDGPEPVPSFPDFADEYLHQPLPHHQLRLWDILCGDEPRDLHPSMRFRPGRRSRVISNFPPDHGKTTSWTVNFVTWLIHRDPDVRVVIVSKTQGMAKRMLGAIKFRLTDPTYREMHLRFAPPGGWKDPDSSWTATEIYVKGRGSGEKDPTVQALGIGGHLYGARSDFIILDDVIDDKNVGGWEDQVNWLAQIVTSRLPDDDEEDFRPDSPGRLLIFGTRIAPIDLYQILRDEFVNYDGTATYTYFAQPAVLEYAEEPKDWLTLWPYTLDRMGRRKRKWDGLALAKRRGDMHSDHRWALTFQQLDVAAEATFPAGAVNLTINGARLVGPIPAFGPAAVRGDAGMNGLYVVAGLDPATVGFTAMIVYGVDRSTRRRFILDAFNKNQVTPHEMRSQIKSFTRQYGIREWRVERNAFQRFLTQDEELRIWLANTGCSLREHYTTAKNKWDEDFGVASLAPLFLSCGTPLDDGRWKRSEVPGLIELPNSKLCRVVGELVEQLITWIPDSKGQRTDLVMALWFAELSAREALGVGDRRIDFLDDPFAVRHDLKKRRVIDLQALAQQVYEAA